MKSFSKLFLRGLFTLLPFGLTVVILFSFLSWTEDLSHRMISVVSPDLYFTGLGLLLGVFLICALGFLTTLPVTSKIIKTIELTFKHVPILNSVFNAAKSLSDFFSPDSEHADQQVVVVKFPGFDAELLGFMTRTHLQDMPSEFSKEDRVAVFLPLSYQIGGLTVFIPRAYIRKTNMKVEVAMRSTLTAWMPGKK